MIQLIDKYGNSYGEGSLEVVDINGKVKTITIPSVWGTITGTLSNQTDLQTALDAKEQREQYNKSFLLGGM